MPVERYHRVEDVPPPEPVDPSDPIAMERMRWLWAERMRWLRARATAPDGAAGPGRTADPRG